MNRRDFLCLAASSAVALRVGLKPVKTHIVTLSFDDGFRKSSYLTADIYEHYGMRACFNVIATGHQSNFMAREEGKPDKGIAPFPKGDFTDWNRLKERGHEVMAHTYDHTNLTEISFAEAKVHITKCAEYFEAHLKGFRASQSVYNFAYNASNLELDAFALTKFLVVRTQGDTPVNPIPTKRKPTRIGCWSHGPGNCEAFFEEALNQFLGSAGGWFVFNLHGLENEGWGPISADYLSRLLSKLSKLENVEVLPAGAVLLRLNG